MISILLLDSVHWNLPDLHVLILILILALDRVIMYIYIYLYIYNSNTYELFDYSIVLFELI